MVLVPVNGRDDIDWGNGGMARKLLPSAEKANDPLNEAARAIVSNVGGLATSDLPSTSKSSRTSVKRMRLAGDCCSLAAGWCRRLSLESLSLGSHSMTLATGGSAKDCDRGEVSTVRGRFDPCDEDE